MKPSAHDYMYELFQTSLPNSHRRHWKDHRKSRDGRCERDPRAKNGGFLRLFARMILTPAVHVLAER
jgi:hypothetical protein